MARTARLALLLAAMVIPLRMLGFAVDASTAVPAAPVHATVHVTIQNLAFKPRTIRIAPGTTVVWTNKDAVAHSVMSESMAWSYAGLLKTRQSFSWTFTKPGSYAYHCHPHPWMTGTVIVVGKGLSSSTLGPMGAMGPMSMRSMMVWTGYYDNHKVLYTWTDTSSKAEAQHMHINYAPSLAKALPDTVAMYMVMNGKYANRGPVFASEPGEDTYTPLWQEVFVTWKDPSKAVLLGKDDQVNDLAKKGLLTLRETKTVVNCSIVMVVSHGMRGMSAGSHY